MPKKKTTIKKTQKPQDDSSSIKSTKNTGLIVGIGASAGGLEAFKEFFTNMPDDPGMAFILVQHLDPTRKSMLVDLVSNYTRMKVSEVTDGVRVEANHVYIIPPNKYLAILNGSLQLLAPQDDRVYRRPVDFFFRSLAADQEENAVGIIFSGTGSEGSLSLKTIKGEGGLTILQDPETAKYDGMPRGAMPGADFVLPAKDIPERLIQYAKNRVLLPVQEVSKATVPKNLIDKIYILLRNETGTNFKDYKDSTVIRRIEKRMIVNQIASLENYVKFLQKNPKEAIVLFKDLLIGVTQFFRDKEVYDQVVSKAIPHIIKNKQNGQTIRIWVAGCSTGEEAFSLAILFNEALSKQKKNIKLQIFASDLDEDAISFARLGLYPETIVADIKPGLLKKYFVNENNAFKIKKEIRDQIVFAEQNVIKDPPFSKLDMVSCRNLLIYLKPETQQKIFAIFHYSLNPDGVMLLGNSESLGESADLFSTLERKSKLFLKKSVKLDKMPEIGFKIANSIAAKKSELSLSGNFQKGSLQSVIEKVLISKFAPPCVIINKKSDAVYFSGETGKYLQPPAGEARLNVIDMAREGLKIELRSAIAKTLKEKSEVVRKNVKVKTNGDFEIVNLHVAPLTPPDDDDLLLIVTFEEQRKVKVDKKVAGKAKIPVEDPSEIKALEEELDSTKQSLRSTIEELEVSNEELKSMNEELQSSNEELQSSNEELETSREEMQSVNEEMATVNSELQSKVDELAQAYNDMNNLLASSEIGTIFLDSELNIKRFTSSITKIINLIQADLGRPVKHLASNLKYDSLTKDSKQVLDTLIPFKKAVQSMEGSWYKMQIFPYRTSENKIDGVVLTFTDISDEREIQQKLSTSQEQYLELLKQTRTTLFKQDKNLRYTEMLNPPSNLSDSNVIGKSDSDLYPKGEALALTKLKKAALKTGLPKREELVTTVHGVTKYYDIIVRAALDENGNKVGVVCTTTEITDLTQKTEEKPSPDKNRDRQEKLKSEKKK